MNAERPSLYEQLVHTQQYWLSSSRGAAQANKAVLRLSRANKWLRKNVRRWVPLDRHRPAVNRLVLVHVVEQGIVSIVIARDTGERFLDDHNHPLGGVPTHWQELPEYPTA